MTDLHVRKCDDKWYYSFECTPIDEKRKRIERVGGKQKNMLLKMKQEAANTFDKLLKRVAKWEGTYAPSHFANI